MNENEDYGFEEFESALFDDSYQTDDETDADDSDVTHTEAPQDADTDEPDDNAEESDEEDPTSDSEEDDDAEGSGSDASKEDAGQTFTLKVNKEERQVTLEEMTAFAQKGADYDRVKGQNEQLRQTNADLQSKLDGMAKHQQALDILGVIASKSGASLDQLTESLYINFRKSAGVSEDTAREELKSAKLEKELDGYKAQRTQQQAQENDSEARAKRDLEAFQKEYPDVALTEELVDKLVPDIRSGMTLSAAYRKYEKAQDTARIAELERKLAAKAQNDRNKRSSPGSQQDSGSRRVKSDYEEFEKALFG